MPNGHIFDIFVFNIKSNRPEYQIGSGYDIK